ncbi:MAG: TetR/AcrR family transcriptional regulator [Rhodanobacter sp.]
MSSQKSTAAARTPRRQRGLERVASLLEAAAACFVEKGYDATTMTEIAARAGAAIGSLYQFFPTKERVAQALLDQYAQALYARLAKLTKLSSKWSTDQLGAGLTRFLVAFRRSHPAFVMLAESTTVPNEYSMAIRQRLRAELQALLGLHAPHLPTAELQAITVAVQQLMKAAVAVNAEPGLTGRKAALEQLQHMMQLYLRTALSN